MRNVVNKKTLDLIRENCPKEIDDINVCISFIINTKEACKEIHDFLMNENKVLKFELAMIKKSLLYKIYKLVRKIKLLVV